MSTELSDELKRFVESQVASGRFKSEIEVIEIGLQLLMEREARLATLREAMERIAA